MAGLKVTSCAHDNPNTKQKDIPSLYTYHFSDQIRSNISSWPVTHYKENSLSSGRSWNTAFPSRSFDWTLKQNRCRHICRTIPLLVISQLLSRCRFPSKHYQMYILGLWQGAKLHFCSCPTSWQQFKLGWERNSNGKLAISTTTRMMNCCSGQHTGI